MTSRIANTFIVALLISTILPARLLAYEKPSPSPVRPIAQGTPPIYTFQECDQAEEASLRDELNRIAQAVFAEERSGQVLTEIVEDNWDETGMDSAVDSAVRAATARVRRRTTWGQRVQSNWSTAWAEWLATRVAVVAFGSQGFRDSFDQLSEEIADDLDKEIRVMAAKSASSVLLCLEEFIGESFSQTMAQVFENQILDKVDVTESDLEAEAREFVDVLESHPELMAGISLIIGAQVARKLAQQMAGSVMGKVATRILGKVATSAIPLVGTVIGVTLIVIDVHRAGEGALPLIKESLQKEKVKAEIRKKVTVRVNEVLEDELHHLARSIADDVYSQWLSFRSRHKRVLELAEANPRFRSILDYSNVVEVEKLTELVVAVEATLEPENLDEMIRKGQVERILALPVQAYVILSVEQVGGEAWDPPELVLAWADLAGEESKDVIVQVVESELYQIASPLDFEGRETLVRVLALEDSILIKELMQLSKVERAALLQLSTPQTKWVLTELSAKERVWLASYLTELSDPVPELFMEYVVWEPALIAKLIDSKELQTELHRVMDLAQTIQVFKSILFGSTAEQVEKLSRLVAVADEILEPEQFVAVIEKGQFERILALPQEAFEILRVDGDPELVLTWGDLAGKAIIQVVDTKLHHVARPSNFRDREELDKVLDIQDTEAIHKLMMLDQSGRDVVLELPTGLIRAALNALTADEFSWLATHLQEHMFDKRGPLLDRVAREPALIAHLRFRDIRKALLESPNAQDTLEMLAVKTRDESPSEIVEEGSKRGTESTDGPIAIVVLSFVSLMSLWIWWQNFHRRPTDTKGTANRTSRVSKGRDRP